MGYSIFWGEGRVQVTYTGQTSSVEVLDVVTRLQGHGSYYSVHQALHDFRSCTTCTHSMAALEHILAINIGASSMMAYKKHTLKIAVVTDRDDVVAMVADFNGMGFNPFPISVFADYHEADTWLNQGDPAQL